LKEWLLRQNDKKNLITFLFFSIITNVDDLFMTELVKKGPTPGKETPSNQAENFLASSANSPLKRTLQGEGEKIVGEAGRIIEKIRAGLAGLSGTSIEYRTSKENNHRTSEENNLALVDGLETSHGLKTSEHHVNHTAGARCFGDLLNFCGGVVYERYAA
jgi:hypothetical protein